VPMVPDPSGGMGNIGEGAIWEIDVTLPNMTCDNCTLQLVQAMNNDTTTPVLDPSPVSSYYTCVDLELVAPGTLDDPGEDPGDEMGDGDGDGMGDDPAMTGSGTPGQGQGTMGGAVQPTDMTGMVGTNTSTGNGMTGSGTTGSTTNSESDSSSGPYGSPSIPGMGMSSSGSGGGCSLRPAHTTSGHGSAFALSSLALALGVLGRRRAQARG
jgi:hypothetical protein